MSQKEFKIRARNRVFDGFDESNEENWNGPFFFIQAADTQFGMIDSYIEKKLESGWQKEIDLTKKAIEAANKMNPKPRFFVVCGDLIDAMPGTPYREDQEKDFKEVFSELDSDIPLVCVCGNHDIGNKPDYISVQRYKHSFGDDYFVFWCGGVMFIVINSQFFEDPSLVEDLASEQNRWLDEQLKKCKSNNCKHAVVFQHIPWFLHSPEEEKEYFNMELSIRSKMLEKFYDSGIRTIFCGHYHRNAGGFYKDMELVVTSAVGAQLGNDKSGLRIVHVQEDSIKHAYYSLDEIPRDLI